MTQKLKVYLDTSVIGFMEQPQNPEKMVATIRFWNMLKEGRFDACISDLMIYELSETPEPKKSLLFEKLNGVCFERLLTDVAVDNMTALYLSNNVLTSKSFDDLHHIAYAVCYRCDVIVSWNFKHFVNPRTIARVNDINLNQGYETINIVSPFTFLEWMENDGEYY